MRPLVSILIPSYCHAGFIAAAIESALQQTLPAIELLIVDDASGDETAAVVESFRTRCEERFCRFVFVRKPQNKGVVDSLKQLVALAQADFFLPMASDDVLEPDIAEILYRKIQEEPDCGLVCADCMLIDAQGARVFWDQKRNLVKEEAQAVYRSQGDLLRAQHPHLDFQSNAFGSFPTLLRGNYIPNGFLWRAEAVRPIIDSLGQGVLEDWSIMLELSKTHRFLYVNQILYRYRQHPTNSVRNRVKVSRQALALVCTQKHYALSHRFAWAFYRSVLVFFLYHLLSILRQAARG